jgi:hypothetical protein
MFDGGAMYLIAEIDTFWVYVYPNGTIEAKIGYTLDQNKKTTYERYYENGRKMWTYDLMAGKRNGYSMFFNEKGNKVASFLYQNDTIVDTLFLTKKTQLLFGKITNESKVYGGMQREDGSSNISHSIGPTRHASFYVVRLNKETTSQKIYKRFKTDINGEFFIEVEEGFYGFFNEKVDIKTVSSNQATEPPKGTGGWHGGWNLTEPFLIQKKPYNFVHLHYSSVGYAP